MSNMSLTLLLFNIEVSPFVCALSIHYKGRLWDRKGVLQHDRVGVPLPKIDLGLVVTMEFKEP